MTPETLRFIDESPRWCRERGLEVLVEVHAYLTPADRDRDAGRPVYDFALPPLVLHALTAADADPLLAWMSMRPANAVTVLDTHDGIGVIDVGADPPTGHDPGLLTPSRSTTRRGHARTAAATSRLATGAAASNVDLYQVNCTFYDALGRDDDRYLLARPIQFFAPGVPQVYYVGLLAGPTTWSCWRAPASVATSTATTTTTARSRRRCNGRWCAPCWRRCGSATPTRRSRAAFLAYGRISNHLALGVLRSVSPAQLDADVSNATSGPASPRGAAAQPAWRSRRAS